MTTKLLAPICIAALALLTGCTPVSLTFTFGAESAQLDETVVWEDEGAGWFAPKVAIIDVRGVVTATPESGPLGGRRPSAVDELIARLTEAGEDGRVKGVVLAINSPGGSVTASDMMYREIVRFKERTGKPVVAHLGEVAASGGYYIALAADEIIAQPTSLTGSIGVIFPTINVSEGLARIGVYSRAIVSRENKDLANPLEPPDPEHFVILQEVVDEMYERFLGLVLARREALAAASPDAIKDVTDGRIITGEKAVAAQLADRVGGLRDAYERVKAMTDSGDAKAIKYHDPLRAVRSIYSQAPAADGEGGVEINLLRLDLAEALSGAGTGKPYYLWVPTP